MSVARHHADWLSLVESSGPFLSMPVLLRVFPQGLEQRDAAKASRLREAYEDWLERGAKQPAVHHVWIRHVLTELLEYPPEFLVEGQAIPPGMEAVIANYGETLRPEFALKHRDADQKPSLLIEHYAPDQDLEKPVAGKVWKASPGTRMMELLHAADVPLGLITNGEQWMIVSAPRGETTGFASWYADLWTQEPITLRAFHSLLHLRRFLGVAEPETLAALYAESSRDQQEVTDQLGYQVRQAVEMLVQAFDRNDAESERKLLAGVSEKALYDSALTVMMRLVFLFSAEERGLLLLGDPLYDQHYAVSTLSELLRERADQQGEEVLERRHDAWCRLLATFRAVHAGVEHEAMRLPPYGGTLFDPDRYPFLEGRAARTQWQTTSAKPLPINNRVVLHLLEALQVLRVKVSGGGPAETRRLSFRALDIEQIGHVYEGLLDHTVKRARETILGLAGSRNNEPEIPLSRLEELSGTRAWKPDASSKTSAPFLLAAETAGNVIPLPVGNTSISYAPPEKLIETLVEETGRSAKAIGKGLMDQSRVDENRLLIACGHDRRLLDRVWKFAPLVRSDTFGFPVVIPEGSVYVTSGSDRRSTGTHYTPRSLTEPIVQHTLEPLVYVGPAEGQLKAEWKLKSPREILALKVCDMAMGSGAFLVQTCRYLGERLVEAWENAEKAHPGQFISTPEGELSSGDPSERLIPADPAERLAIARRYVADRCLYGVDINPMAVEMAKLSLWLITLQRDRPFTFLDHALKCGDSLLGVSSVQQIENFSLRPGERQVTFATANLFRYVDEATVKRRALEDLPSNDHTQIETKNRLHAEAEAATAKVKALADCLIAFELRGLDGDAYDEQRANEAEKVQLLMNRDANASLNSQSPTINQLSAHVREQLHGRRPFHWSVEFPEVFARGGFDAFVGNPPFSAVRLFARQLGQDFAKFLFLNTPEAAGNVDLAIFFLRRFHDLLSAVGCGGMIVTNSVGEGDNRHAGLDVICSRSKVYRAWKSLSWPGAANVSVSLLFFTRRLWDGPLWLDGTKCSAISSELKEQSIAPNPNTLAELPCLSFRGSDWNGDGFVVDAAFVQEQLRLEPQSRDFLLPLLNASDYCDKPDQSANRFAVFCRDLTLEELQHRVPKLLEALKARVFAERSVSKDKRLRENWWLFRRPTIELYDAAWKQTHVFVNAFTAKFVCFGLLRSKQVFANALNVYVGLDWWGFAVLQSTAHDAWARDRGSYLEDRLRYTPTDCLETFPFPPKTDKLLAIGTSYYELRCQIMQTRQEGLTKTYNRFHDRGEQSADIARLQALHEEMDQAVTAAYGWSDLDLGHGFHATKQGERYTLSESARRTVLDRLLALNHQRYAEEVKAGLHDKGAKKPKKPKSIPTSKQRILPVEFRLSAADGAHYAVSLIFALLSEAGGSLPLARLRDAFVLATIPKLMVRLAPAEDAARVKAWAQRWKEDAQPSMFLDSLKAIGARHLGVNQGAEGRIFQLLDGPRAPANEDVGYDAWIALRISATLAPSAVLLPECAAWTKEAEELVLT